MCLSAVNMRSVCTCLKCVHQVISHCKRSPPPASSTQQRGTSSTSTKEREMVSFMHFLYSHHFLVIVCAYFNPKIWCWNSPYLAKGFNVHSSFSLNVTNMPLITWCNTDTASTKMQRWRWILTMELPLHGNFKNEHTRCHYTTIISSNLLHWLLSSLDEVDLKSRELYMCMNKTDLQVINVAKIY